MKINTKYRLVIKAVLVAAVFISCEDDLNQRPNDTQTVDDFLSNKKNAIQLVNGTYNKLLDYGMNSFSWIGITSITSDDADKGSIPSDTGTDKDKLEALNFETSGLSFNHVYRSRYDGIRRVNEAIMYLEKSTIPGNIKTRLIGECKFSSTSHKLYFWTCTWLNHHFYSNGSIPL